MATEQFTELAQQTAEHRAVFVSALAALRVAQNALQAALQAAASAEAAYIDSRNQLESAANRATFPPQTALDIAAGYGIALGHSQAEMDAIKRGDYHDSFSR